MPSLTKLVVSRVSTTSALDAAGAGVGVLLAAAFYLGLFLPLGRQAQWRTDRMDQLRALVAGSDVVASDHQQLDSRLKELKAAAEVTRGRMGPPGSASDFIDATTRAAKAEGLTVSQISASSPQITPATTSIDVSCRVSGSYASVCRFLAAVSQLPQISTVKKLDLNGAANLSQYPLDVTFRLYCLREPHDIENK